MSFPDSRRTVIASSSLSVLFLAVFAFGLFSFRLGAPDLYDYDEGMNAEIAREMLVSKQWLVPTFNGVPYFEKPPFIYWVTASSFRLFGPTDWAGRFPVALLGVIGILALFSLVRLWADSRAAIYAGLVLATAFGYFLYTRIIMFDIPLTTFLVITLLAFSIGCRDPKRGTAAALLACSGMAVAVMIKGLVGLILPAVILALFWYFSRNRPAAKLAPWLAGVALLLLVVLPWHWAAARLQPGSMAFYLWHGQILRYLSGGESLDVSPLGIGAYLAMAAVWSFPWMLFLPQAVLGGIRAIRRDEPGRDLLVLAFIWAGVGIGFFALSRSRLEYYSIPALPALAILIGRWWSREPLPSRGLRYGFVAMFLLAVGGAGFLWFSFHANVSFARDLYAVIDESYRNSLERKHLDTAPPSLPGPDDLLPSMIASAVAVFTGAIVGLWAQSRGRRTESFAAVVLTSVVLLIQIHHGLVVFEPYRSVAPLAKRVAALAGEDDVVAVMGPYEKASPLAFYTRRRVTVVNGFQGDLEYGRRVDPSADPFFLDNAAFQKLWSSSRRVFLIADGSPGASGYPPIPNLSYKLGEQPGRAVYSNRP